MKIALTVARAAREGNRLSRRDDQLATMRRGGGRGSRNQQADGIPM